MKINENTIIRVRVPKELYESVKAQLTLKEAKNTYGVPEGTVIKEKKKSDGPEKSSAPKAKNPSTPKTHEKAKAPKAPQKETGASETKMKKVKKNGISLEELKFLHELLGEKIGQMEEGIGKVEEAEKIGKRNFTYTDANGETKYVTADDLDKARELANKFGGDENTVKAVSPKVYKKKGKMEESIEESHMFSDLQVGDKVVHTKQGMTQTSRSGPVKGDDYQIVGIETDENGRKVYVLKNLDPKAFDWNKQIKKTPEELYKDFGLYTKK